MRENVTKKGQILQWGSGVYLSGLVLIKSDDA